MYSCDEQLVTLGRRLMTQAFRLSSVADAGCIQALRASGVRTPHTWWSVARLMGGKQLIAISHYAAVAVALNS
jgi:hypothetical protein